MSPSVWNGGIELSVPWKGFRCFAKRKKKHQSELNFSLKLDASMQVK
jgi:hypothetical protein